MEVNGQRVHFWGPTVLSIQDTGHLSMDRVHQSILVGLNNTWSWPDLVYAWGLNNFSGTPSEIEVLTPTYGSSTNIANGIAVVVENGLVTDVHTGNTPIPKNGFVVEMGLSANNQQIAAGIHVGEAAAYRVNVTNFAGNNLDFSHVIDAIGAGPLLVDKGQVAVTTPGRLLSNALTVSYGG